MHDIVIVGGGPAGLTGNLCAPGGKAGSDN